MRLLALQVPSHLGMTTAKKSAKKSSRDANPCWPGFEPVPGKQPRSKDSCRPEPGPHSAAAKKATQKAAAASKLERAGKPNPNAKTRSGS
jgi:hypothetical protein